MINVLADRWVYTQTGQTKANQLTSRRDARTRSNLEKSDKGETEKKPKYRVVE